jgi:uncharacterized protein (DUF433 family)
LKATWEACELVERVSGKVAGRPVVRGTRVEPDFILTDFELGSPIEEIHENSPSISIETIKRLLDFAHDRQSVA